MARECEERGEYGNNAVLALFCLFIAAIFTLFWWVNETPASREVARLLAVWSAVASLSFVVFGGSLQTKKGVG